FTAAYCAVGLTETWCLLCVPLALLSLDAWLQQMRAGKPWNAWLLGLVLSLGFSILLRPDQALLSVAVLPVMQLAGWRASRGMSPASRLGPAAAICAGLLLPLLLWGARNWRVFHVANPIPPKYANDPGEPVSYG